MNELLFYLTVYSFFGWILENVSSYLTEGKWKEPFLKGPYKPMYGIAPVLLLLLGKGQPFPVVLLLCLAVPTAVEFVSGYVLHKAFNHRWWSYERMKFQLGGHICLRYSVYWTVLSFLVLKYLHPFVAESYGAVETVWSKALPLFALLVLTDLVWTVLQRRSAVKDGVMER